MPLKKGMGKFQRHLPLKLNQSPSKLGSLPVEVIGFSSQGQNAYRTLVSEACLRRSSTLGLLSTAEGTSAKAYSLTKIIGNKLFTTITTKMLPTLLVKLYLISK